ncbi:unnamed protein product [Gongylonema pulchrum]|uniref:LAM_G_DOMAIN domain-containing protein n=1 Tax=Gongylonema pulchrum TaxID=637853 RepID=A0A183CWW8_9BILA|nr:unnamed protein product [Gongylonema pulchrum]
MLLLFFWTLATHEITAQSEIPAKTITLLSNASFIEHAPVTWDYEGDGSQIILPIRIRTRSVSGRLITLIAQIAQETVFSLSAYIDNAAVVIELADGSGKLLKKTQRQLPGVNNGMEHSMSIHVNPQTKILKVVYGQGTVDSYDFTDEIKVHKLMNLTIITGKHGIFA